MLLKRNLLESLTIASSSGTILLILLNYLTNISPLQGVWFPIYLFSLFFASVFLSFKSIQWLIHLNKPLAYDLDGVKEKYPVMGYFVDFLPRRPVVKKMEFKEYDTNELSVISTVLERRLVSSWYVPYVSQEIGFPFACKQMLDQIIGKTFQICSKIETKDVYIDICSIFITHLKEYKKALKRHEKLPNHCIEHHFKKSHPVYTNQDTKYTLTHTADHCVNTLRIILKELVPWELWDTPHSELLVRILAKKLDNFILNSLTNPDWLNDKLISFLTMKQNIQTKDVNKTEDNLNKDNVDGSTPDTLKEENSIEEAKNSNTEVREEIKEIKEVKDTVAIEPKEIDIIKPETTTIESALSTLITKSTAPILQCPVNGGSDVRKEEMVEDIVEEREGKRTEPVDINTSPLLRQRRGRQGRNEVKIYDRIVEGSVKTWDTDGDLQCISLGQDLLASLDGEITLSRLWGQEHDSDKNQLWFGEDAALEDALDSKVPSPVKKELSPKPAELLRDLQTTVHQAKSKIGDLQVPATNIDVPRNNDEAAGMMEGLLDFGIAGLKKGLRFTGLSDETQEKSPSHQRDKERSLDKAISFEPSKNRSPTAAAEAKEAFEDLQKEDVNGGNSVPQLVKQQRVASQDSVASQPRPILRGSPPLPPLTGADSPEPEYEEAADLSTSIAKLRTLLQQRAESTQRVSAENGDGGVGGGEVWQGGEGDTRTHTQRHDRPIDTATLADEYDMQADRTSPGHGPNNMQRLDRLLHSAMSGVFNSLRTAVGAEDVPHTAQDWTYVSTTHEVSVCAAVSRLVGSRRAASHVEAALDSLDQLPAKVGPKPPPPDDFEEWCACEGGAWCATAELCCASGLCRSHLAYRIATLLVADLAESIITYHLSDVGEFLRKCVFEVFERMQEEEETSPVSLKEFNIEETCQVLMDWVTESPLQYIFGSETLSSSIRLLVSSVSHRALNRELACRLLDVVAAHFRIATAHNTL